MSRTVNIPTESQVSVNRSSLARAWEQYQRGERLDHENFAVLNKALKQRGGTDAGAGPGIVSIDPNEEGQDRYGTTAGLSNPFQPFLEEPETGTESPATMTGDVPDNFEGSLPGPDREPQPTTELPTPTIPEPGDDGRNVDLSDSLVVVFVVGIIIWVLSRVFR